MKILRVLIILALVLFPFGELLRFEIGNNVVVRPLDAVVGLALIAFLFEKKFQISNFKYPISKLVGVFFILGLGSLLINLTWLKLDEFFASALYLVRWIAYAALLPIILSFDERFRKKLLSILFIDGLIILVAGFFQYFFFSNLKSLYHLGWDEHMHRLFSVFFDPNFAGAFFVLFFLFVGGILVLLFKPHPNPLLKGEGSWFRYFLVFVLILTLVAIFLTFSRSALLMLITGSITFLILIRKKILIAAVLGAVLLFGLIASPKFYDENMNLFREASSKARLANYSVALQLIKDRPLLGVGFNSYRYAKEEYGIQMGWVKAPSHADAGVDNSFLFVLATTGIVGFIAYCLLIIAILKRSYYLYKKRGSVLSAVVIASVVGLSVNALFINSLFFPALMLWMWMLIALQDADNR